MEVFGILELDLPLGSRAPEKPAAQLIVENQKLLGHVIGGKSMRFRFSPKATKTFTLSIRSNVPALDGQSGAITAIPPEPLLAQRASTKFPELVDRQSVARFGRGPHSGAKSVSRWREEFLYDFAERMDRCKSPLAGREHE